MPAVDWFVAIGTEKHKIHVCEPLETSLEEEGEEEVWRCLACSLWRGWGEFWGLGVPFAAMLLGEAVFMRCFFPFLGSAVEGEGFPWLPWLSAGLCRQDLGRKERRRTPQPWALAISGRVDHLGVGGELVSKPAQRGCDWVYVRFGGK